jgi:hypothetical protein
MYDVWVYGVLNGVINLLKIDRDSGPENTGCILYAYFNGNMIHAVN